jgi:Protein of unknown function (DUF1631)
VGLPDRHDHLEVIPLKLRAEHFPFPCSLRELVLERYVDPQSNPSAAIAMDVEEIIGYLRNTDDYELTPMDTILSQTEAIGDPSLPTPEDTAILQWLGAALKDWEERFTLEDPLASQLRRLKPLAAILAITDPQFLVPGAHPLHQLLDTIQLNAIGWQQRLGRAGQALEKQVAHAVEGALAWLESDDTDLAAISAQMLTSAERDRARAGRMAQRLIETEQGRIKTAEAKQRAAEMINAALEQYQAPASIGEFLKGPWYDSAQLVLLKFGVDSEQWRQISSITTTLLDSVRVPDSEEGDRRQYIFEVVTQLPKDLKRWLLSLQHDSEAVSDAMGVVEFVHLRVLRRQELELEKIDPIPIAQSGQVDEALHKALERMQAGQWFSLDTGDGEPLRARLVLRMDSEQQLLFSNHTGIKVLQQSFTEFVALMGQGKVKLLDSGASFSRALAGAAGIQTTEELEAISDVVAAQFRREQEAQVRLEQQRQQRELEETQRRQHNKQQAPTMGGAPAGQESTPKQQSELNLPMGAWLGFHDGDMPLLAKLAVHDREQNTYIFVNRSGIKIRQLNRKELLLLIENGLVDILETKSRFREEITRVRQQPEN